MKLLNWILLKRIIVAPAFFFCNDANTQIFTVNGVVAGKDTGFVKYSYRDEYNQRISGITPIQNEKFQINGKIAGADYILLDTDTSQIDNKRNYGGQFFIEPGIISIFFNDGEADKAHVKGSKSHKEYFSFRKSQEENREKLKSLTKAADSIKTLLKEGMIIPLVAEEKISEIDKKYIPIAYLLKNNELKYIRTHPNSYLSINFLLFFVGRISNDSLDVLYASLAEKVKNSSLGYRFVEHYSRYRKAISNEYSFDKVQINDMAPSFTIYNILNQDSMAVQNFKGKVVLLDFWGLSCFPCLKANPQFEEIRKKYSKEDFKIVSINVNGSKEIPQLISYINKNKFQDWIHVNISPDVKQTNDLILKGEFSNYYGLGVPRTVVIGRDSKILYKSFGYSPEEMEKLKVLIDSTITKKGN